MIKEMKWMFDKEGKLKGKNVWKAYGKVVVSNAEESGLFYDSSNRIPYVKSRES